MHLPFILAYDSELLAKQFTLIEKDALLEVDWKELMEQVQAEMDGGTDPADERVQQLARRWMGLVQEFTGGNPGITQSLGRMYKEETTVAGMDTAHMRQMMEYVGKAMATAKKPD